MECWRLPNYSRRNYSCRSLRENSHLFGAKQEAKFAVVDSSAILSKNSQLRCKSRKAEVKQNSR